MGGSWGSRSNPTSECEADISWSEDLTWTMQRIATWWIYGLDCLVDFLLGF
jgi:hypothetical protein